MNPRGGKRFQKSTGFIFRKKTGTFFRQPNTSCMTSGRLAGLALIIRKFSPRSVCTTTQKSTGFIFTRILIDRIKTLHQPVRLGGPDPVAQAPQGSDPLGV
jgi:hypothetical protein